MGLAIDLFKEWSSQFRINKYKYALEIVGSCGDQIHTDSGFLTVLQDDENVRGLEDMDKNSGASHLRAAYINMMESLNAKNEYICERDEVAACNHALFATGYGLENGVNTDTTCKQPEIDTAVIATGIHTLGKAAHVVDCTNQVRHLQNVLTAVINFCICYIVVVRVLELALKRQMPFLTIAEDEESEARAQAILNKLRTRVKLNETPTSFEENVENMSYKLIKKLREKGSQYMAHQDKIGIVTGNWGCGAFGGDPELKAIIQWLAASQALRPFIAYYTFGIEELRSLDQVTWWITSQKWNVGDLWNMLVEYSSQKSRGEINAVCCIYYHGVLTCMKKWKVSTQGLFCRFNYFGQIL